MDELGRCEHASGLGLEDEIEDQLHSKAQTADHKEVLRYWHHLRYQLDQQAGVKAEEQQFERRWSNLIQKPDGGYHLGADLDAEGGTKLRTAIAPLAKRRGKDDLRSAQQRRADALVELAERALDSGELPSRGGQKPHLIVTASLETLRLTPGSPLAKLDWGATITGESARRIASDAVITPVLVGKQGDVLHVGAATRVVPPRMRKALNLRDVTCRVPGCTMPAADCIPHHERHFIDGGPTIPSNLTLLCSVHHRERHPENARFYSQARGDPP
jgi:hypothetical protein